MDKIQGITLAVIAGISFAVQSPINASLGKALSPKVASFHSVLTSAVIMGTIIFFSSGFKSYKNIIQISPLYWVGGLLGIIVVFLIAKVIPVLGTTITLSVFVSIQIITGAIINNFGILGVNKDPIDLIKVIGIAFILIGVRFVIR